MSPTRLRVISLTIAIVASQPGVGRTAGQGRLLAGRLESGFLEQARTIHSRRSDDSGNRDPRCQERARPPQVDEDKRVREQGWDLVGPYQGGWEIVVIRGTAGYDGMCRPRQYQDFVFVRGAFVGTLSPHADGQPHRRGPR